MPDGDESPLPFPSPSAILADPPADAAPLPPPPHEPHRKKDTNHARRPSKDNNKKVAAARKAAAPEANDANIVKPKQTKSRNGCVTCKAKRLKCGEEKPGCQNCAKRKVPCGGYKKTFQWRDYGKPDVKASTEKPSKQTSPPRPLSGESSKANSPTSEFPPVLSPKSLATPQSKDSRTDVSLAEADEEARKSPLEATVPSEAAPEASTKRDSALTLPPEAPSDPVPPQEAAAEEDPDEFASVSFDRQAVFTYRSRSLSPSHALPSSTLTEFLFSDEVLHPLEFNQQDFVTFTMPGDMNLPLWSAADETILLAEESLNHGMGFIEPMPPPDGLFNPWLNQADASSSSQSPMSPGLTSMSPHSMEPHLTIQPNFALESIETLSMLYDRTTCGILSIMDGPTENPWRTVVWPMAQSSQALMHAILAMTAYHNSQQHRTLKRIGHEHKNHSIRFIQEGIQENSMTDQTALATALALTFAESWDRHTESGSAHVHGAQILVKQVLENHRLNPRVGLELKKLKFLCNAWVFVDVMARLTYVDMDDSTDFDIRFCSVPNAPESFMGNGGARNDGFGINFGMPVDTRLDPLMGCAGTLFPYIGRVANLIRKVCRSLNNSPGIVSTARDLNASLDDWEPPEEIDRPEDPFTRTQHAVQTAEAYRLATLLHLHSAVPELPSSSSADLSRKVLAALATIPMDSRTVVVQMYPLLAAGCEAQEMEDRQWVRERWHAMYERMGVGVIERCLAVTEEVWRRKDVYESRPINNRKLVKTEELRRGRQNGAPRGSLGPGQDPGTMGIVYSWADADSETTGMMPLKDINGPEAARFKKDVADRVKVDPAYSVRGHLHWAGICHEWNYELLLA